MNRARWLISLAIGLAPMLGGMALRPSADTARPVSTVPQAKVTNPHGPIAIPCQNCHTYTSWKPIRSNPEFNHDQTGYALRGMHEKVACTKCHTSLVFKNVSTTCADCHADIHRRQFGANCEKLPLSQGLASFGTVHPEPPEPVSPGRRACIGGMRPVPQERGRRTVHRAVYRLLFMPSAGLSDSRDRSRRFQVPHHLRKLPHHGHVVRREVQPPAVHR